MTRTVFEPWNYCDCGHPWLLHDIREQSGDGTDLCCAEGCDQFGCPGTSRVDEVPPELTEGDHR